MGWEPAVEAQGKVHVTAGAAGGPTAAAPGELRMTVRFAAWTCVRGC